MFVLIRDFRFASEGEHKNICKGERGYGLGERSGVVYVGAADELDEIPNLIQSYEHYGRYEVV